VPFPNDLFDSLLLPATLVAHALFAIRSQATTPAEMSLGTFTCRKLKTLDTKPLWQAGSKHKQLDQFHTLGMFSAPMKRPPDAIVLRQHWQYHIKRDGTCCSRLCCNGSLGAAPALHHHLAETYSSCVDQHVQHLFFALSAFLSYKIFGGNTHNAFAHYSPPPDIDTYVNINDAYIEWYFLLRFGIRLSKDKVLKVLHALQGHPESGKLWERLIIIILLSKSFVFVTTTTRDKSIYRGSFLGVPILLLRQVDDFLLPAPDETVALAFYQRVGEELQLPGEVSLPFTYLGLVTDFSGVDIHQYSNSIVLSCTTYIDGVLVTHNWTTLSPSDAAELSDHSKIQSPLPHAADTIPALSSSEGPSKDTPEHQRLVDKYGFTYHGLLLGELL
jgi:hypothetical protein